MRKQLPKREAIEKQYTWDLTHLFKSEEAYEQELEMTLKDVDAFVKQFKNQLQTPKQINRSLDMYQDIQARLIRLNAYASLHSSTDSLSETNQMRQGKTMIKFQEVSKKMSFYSNTLLQTDNEILRSAGALNPAHALYVEELIKDKKHRLTPEVEDTLVALSPVLNAAYGHYNRFKLADMSFDDFEVDGISYPNSFTLFENEYQQEVKTEVRRKAYETFYKKLSTYQHGLASNYYTHLQKEKTMSELRGYTSVYDYLLDGQKVPKSLMDRQIDIIMESLAPAMRKYAKLLQKVHGLDKMTYADLKIPVDPTFEHEVTIEGSKAWLKDGLAVLGDDYQTMVDKALNERWIDYPQNQGKSTGGFCSSPYGAPSYILINWNGQMDEVMVLAHEIGHAGHFQYANASQSLLNTRPSMYFIEAPSTTNELLMANHLMKNAKSKREKRWIQSITISRTYYHNFVTHLLEAAFQREVYDRLDQKQPLSAHLLNQLKLKVLKKFWGDAVDIPDWAGLTWMRQPHYFMGLYPYTYSAGLTLGTKVSQMIENKDIDPKDWIEVLKAGGTKTPLELAKMVGVDLNTDKVLKEVIDYISQMIDDIVEA